MESYPVGRRQVLTGLTVVVSGIAGCSGVLGIAGDQSRSISMLAAGSLNNALENGLKQTVDATVDVQAHGSAEIARLIKEGQKDPDIVAISDISLFDSPLHPSWYAEFATNSIVVACNPDTDKGRQLMEAGFEHWYQPLLNDTFSVGRTDPNLDPLGYRTLFMLELASEYYDTNTNLRETIPRQQQIYPETQLISQFETGSIDAAFVYRNMAVERNYEYIDLPVEIDLSDPRFIDRYSSATYNLPSEKVVRGGLISYGATVRQQSPKVVDVFKQLITGQYLHDFGFVAPDDYPHYTDNAPDTLTN